ncbi:MAG: hypothetical protein ACD_65C00357G0004 [uncultured bacterium]|nr:MAG: hypothetical protein ACD_65C00357G0004 [uncultured bacterium]
MKYKDLTLDIEKRIARRKKHKVELRRKESEMLEILMRKNETTVSKIELAETIWDRNAEIVSNTIEAHMSTLRKKIDSGFKKKLIHTIPCAGYKLEEH